MAIYLSERLKKYRKMRDLTQEEVADIFNVSPQTVSRWETGTNCPDIEMLPHIALFFKVTVDELLGTEEIHNEEKVREYIKDIRNLLNSGKINDAIEKSRKATKEHPLNSSFQYHLIQALRADDSEKHKDEITAICERVVNTEPNNWGFKRMLIEQYAAYDKKEEAKKILTTLPSEIWDSQESLWGLVLEGEEWVKNQQYRIVRAKYYLESLIRDYLDRGNLDTLQELEGRKAKLQIERLIDTISGEKIEPIGCVFEHIGIARLYCEAGDSENALDYVEKATQDAMYHIEQMDKTNEDDGGNYLAWSTRRNLPWILWEDSLAKPQFDIVRNDERFIKCFDLLKANSKELK